ncbi:hypothetical protein [Streptomyces sp. NPDC003863]
MMPQRRNISSGSSRESVLGYSRAIRIDNQAFVADTMAGSTTGAVGGADAAAQAHKIFGDIRPVTEIVEVGALAAEDFLVEVETDAVPQ